MTLQYCQPGGLSLSLPRLFVTLNNIYLFVFIYRGIQLKLKQADKRAEILGYSHFIDILLSNFFILFDVENAM